MPIVNVQGFRRGSRYLPDRRDLNRYFPGNPTGSAAARIAHSFFTNVVAQMRCTGRSAYRIVRTGKPPADPCRSAQSRCRDPGAGSRRHGHIAQFSGGRHAAPRGDASRHTGCDPRSRRSVTTRTQRSEARRQGHRDADQHESGMQRNLRRWSDPEPVYYRSSWVRADSGGILFSDVSLGSTVREGDLLGTITDPMSNVRTELRSPYSGRIIGMARNQVVMPGFAAFHVGIATATAPVDPCPSRRLAHDGENGERRLRRRHVRRRIASATGDKSVHWPRIMSDRKPLYSFWGPRYWPTWFGLALLRLVCLLPHRLALGIGKLPGPIRVTGSRARRRAIVQAQYRALFPGPLGWRTGCSWPGATSRHSACHSSRWD